MNRVRWAVVLWLVPDYCNSRMWPDPTKIKRIPGWRLRLAEWLKRR